VLELGTFVSLGGTAAAGYCFTDRSGGSSEPPYDGLNLSFDVGDEPAVVAANREWLLEQLEPRGLTDSCWLRAEHGRRVVEVRGADDALSDQRFDAAVTRRPGLALAALSADCALVVLADPAAGVVGAVHCGRPGLVAGVLDAAAQALRDLGAVQLQAAVGPTVCGRCYQLPVELADAVTEAVPAGRAGRGYVDIRAGVVAQLLAAGVTAPRLVGGCTREDPALFSYRRDGSTGRLAALVWMRP
jgi:YfiH family protein